MQDTASASMTKERIMVHIRSRGPALPIQIAKFINLSPLFASAFLSELYREGRIKISNTRVGSSPLYYIEGQEPQLENFVEHLNQKEREAFTLLKKNKFLFDSEQEPAIRVALRAIKDFAIPFKKSLNNEEKIIWRFFLNPESDLQLSKKEENKEIVSAEIQDKPTIQTVEKIQEKIEEIKDPIKEEVKEVVKEKPKTKKKSSVSDSKFLENIKSYLESKNIELTSLVSEKRKDFAAKIKIDMPFGKQELLALFKDKKKLSEDDLALALHRAQQERMPALILTPGEVDKKAIEFHNKWSNLIKIEKVKI